MILVDTSVWVDHFKSVNRALEVRLEEGEVGCHPFIIGELAGGILHNRAEILELLGRLPSLPVVDHAEALALVDRRKLSGRGLGWIDVHLLASALIDGSRLWTLDRRLRAAAVALDLYSE